VCGSVFVSMFVCEDSEISKRILQLPVTPRQFKFIFKMSQVEVAVRVSVVCVCERRSIVQYLHFFHLVTQIQVLMSRSSMVEVHTILKREFNLKVFTKDQPQQE